VPAKYGGRKIGLRRGYQAVNCSSVMTKAGPKTQLCGANAKNDHGDYDEGDDQEHPLSQYRHIEPHGEKIAKRAGYVARRRVGNKSLLMRHGGAATSPLPPKTSSPFHKPSLTL